MRSVGIVFWDAADTLFELAEPVASVYARFFREFGSEVSEESVRGAFGRVFSGLAAPDFGRYEDGDEAERVWWAAVVRETAVACGLDLVPEEMCRLFEGLFSHYAGGEAYRVFPETVGVLEAVAGMGLKQAVVSNFDRRLYRILEELGLNRWFCRVVSSADARVRKPDPEIFRYALEGVGMGPEEALHVGDSESADVMGARAAGVSAFWVKRPEWGLEAALDWIKNQNS